MNIDYALIGERIRNERKKKGLTQEQLSEKIDLTTVYLSRIERGTVRVNLKRLAQLANVLEVPIELLISGTTVDSKIYLDKELYNILSSCTPEKQRLIYNIAKIVLNSDFV